MAAEQTGMPASVQPRGEIAPAVVLVGDLILKILEYAEHLDFLLSVRDEKLATILQIYRDFGWWLVAAGSALWLYYEYKRRQKDDSARGSIGSLLASVAFVSFLLGSLITVKATGSLPNLIVDYGGVSDPSKPTPTCTVDVDMSRLVGFADDYRMILICGMVDPTTEPLDDTRIAVSSPFHIDATGAAGFKGIVAPLGKLLEVVKSAGTPPANMPSPMVQFQMWHALALIPKDVQSDKIKQAADVKQVGGRILTQPLGGWSSPMALPISGQSANPKQS